MKLGKLGFYSYTKEVQRRGAEGSQRAQRERKKEFNAKAQRGKDAKGQSFNAEARRDRRERREEKRDLTQRRKGAKMQRKSKEDIIFFFASSPLCAFALKLCPFAPLR